MSNGSGLVDARRELDAVLADLKTEIHRRAGEASRTAHDAADAGLASGRDVIRSNPFASVLVAVAVGAGIGLLMTSRRPQVPDWRLPQWRAADWRARGGEWADYLASRANAADMREMARTLRTSAGGALDEGRSGLMSATERVMGALASMDPKSSFGPAVEKIGGWIESARDYMAKR